MSTWYVIQTHGYRYSRIDYTMRYSREDAMKIVTSGYGKGPNGDLYSMIKMHG